jgi:TRAP-type C4-dicarboxylate transport system substrate-binding protein
MSVSLEETMKEKPLFAGYKAYVIAGCAALFVGAGVLGAAGPARAEPVLKFATAMAPSNAVTTQCLKPIVDNINKKAGTDFKIQLVHAPTLANLGNVWDRVANGVADIGFGIHGSSNLPFPKSTVAGLPLLLPVDKLAEGSVALWHLYASGLIADEYKGVMPIALFTVPVQVLSMREPIKSIDDLKGKKIRAADKTISLMVEAVGASPISVPATETYQAVSQGLVSGSVANIIQLTVFRLAEVSKNQIVDIPLGSPAGFVVMNPAVPGKLSEKGRKVLEAETGEKMSREMGACFQKLDGFLWKKLEADKTQHFIKLAPAEKAKFEKALQTVNNEWINTTPDGKKIFASFSKDIGK